VQRRRSVRLAAFGLAALIALSGCRATGRAANRYFDWGGRVFTTNPGSVVPYCLGFGAFFIAGLPLDLFTWIATAIGWPEGRGEDYQGSALAPSIFLGTSGGLILGAPFFPLGLPWWDPDREDTDPPPGAPAPAPPAAPAPDDKSAPPPPPPRDPKDPGEIPAGAPRR